MDSGICKYFQDDRLVMTIQIHPETSDKQLVECLIETACMMSEKAGSTIKDLMDLVEDFSSCMEAGQRVTATKSKGIVIPFRRGDKEGPKEVAEGGK